MKTSTKKYLDSLFNEAAVVELRHHLAGTWRSGLFDCPEKVWEAVETAGDWYTSLNVPKSRRADNAMVSKPLTDADIERVIRLPFDFDPERPPGCPSSEAELQTAHDARARFLHLMHARDWPQPLVAMSGNGYHLQYRCLLPANAETREMLAAIYRGLKTEVECFDPTVRNPSRIFRLYGTVNCKGTPTRDRPHRMTWCKDPGEWRQVTRQQVEKLANYFARQAPPQRVHAKRINGAGDYRTLDVVRWFASHQLYKRPLGDGKHAVTCPWLGEHSTPDHPSKTDTVIWEADGGWPGFHCSHNHCDGRDIRDVLPVLGDADAHCGEVWS